MIGLDESQTMTQLWSSCWENLQRHPTEVSYLMKKKKKKAGLHAQSLARGSPMGISVGKLLNSEDNTWGLLVGYTP